MGFSGTATGTPLGRAGTPSEPTSYLAAKRMPNGKLGVVEKRFKAGKPRLAPEEKRAQATAMMMRRIFGEGTLVQLGEEFGLAPKTVSRRLEGARADGVPDEAREIFIREMLPGAMAVVQEALLSEDIKYALQAAKMVIDGLKVMDSATLSGILNNSHAEETLEIYRERIKLSRSGAAPSQGEPADLPSAPAARNEPVVEGEVVPGRPAAADPLASAAAPGVDQGSDLLSILPIAITAGVSA